MEPPSDDMDTPAQSRPRQVCSTTPANYLRIPGLVFDPIPELIPHQHRAALFFLQPPDVALDLPWHDYYLLLQPFDHVASKLVDVFEYCIDELKHGCYAEPSRDNVGHDNEEKQQQQQQEEEMEEKQGGEKDAAAIDWQVFFERVLELLGPSADDAGLGYLDVMWIVFLYTRAYQSTPRWFRVRHRGYWRRANIHYFHDVLKEWAAMLVDKDLRWSVVFRQLFLALRADSS